MVGSFWCGSRAAAAAALQWQAVVEGFRLPPLLPHASAAAVTVTGSPGTNHSAVSAGAGENGDAERLPWCWSCSSGSKDAAASSAIPA